MLLITREILFSLVFNLLAKLISPIVLQRRFTNFDVARSSDSIHPLPIQLLDHQSLLRRTAPASDVSALLKTSPPFAVMLKTTTY